jgi:hypothetical protein
MSQTQVNSTIFIFLFNFFIFFLDSNIFFIYICRTFNPKLLNNEKCNPKFKTF